MNKIIILFFFVLLLSHCSYLNDDNYIQNSEINDCTFIGDWETLIEDIFVNPMRAEYQFTDTVWTLLLATKVNSKDSYLYYEGGRGIYSYDDRTITFYIHEMFSSDYVNNIDNVIWEDCSDQNLISIKEYKLTPKLLSLRSDNNEDGDFNDIFEILNYIRK